MRKNFCKTLLAGMLVFAILFAMCAISYADTTVIQANDKGSPVLQTDIISVMPTMIVKEVRVDLLRLTVNDYYNYTSPIRYIDTGNELDAINTLIYVNHRPCLHIEPGKC